MVVKKRNEAEGNEGRDASFIEPIMRTWDYRGRQRAEGGAAHPSIHFA
jgi:hypothetical protein